MRESGQTIQPGCCCVPSKCVLVLYSSYLPSKAADLVRAERRGQQIVYSLNTSVFEEVEAMLLELFRVDREKKGERS